MCVVGNVSTLPSLADGLGYIASGLLGPCGLESPHRCNPSPITHEI